MLRDDPRRPADEEPPEHPDDPEQPIWQRHKPPIWYQPRVLLAVLIVVVFVGAVALAARHGTWPPKAQCGAPKVTGSVGHVKKGNPVYWAATGRADTYAVTFGATSARIVGGKVEPVGSESMAAGKAFVVRQPATLSGCRYVGHFTMPFPTGEYHLRLFRVDGSTATQVASARVDSDG